MISLVLVVSALAAVVFLLRKRALRRQGAEGRVAFGLYAYSFEFFAVLAAVLAVYHLLLLFLVFGWQYVSVGRLLWLERSLNGWRSLLSRWTPGWIATLVILAVIYVWSLLQVRIFEAQGLLRGLKKTKTVLRIANIVLVALCSFTLLGSDAGQPVATLEIRLQTVRKEYGVLRGQVKQTALGVAANRLNDKTTEALGPRYASAPQLLDRVESGTTALRERYDGFKRKYKEPNAQVEQTLRHYEVRETARRAAEAQAAKLTAPEMVRNEHSEGVSLSDAGRNSGVLDTADESSFEGALPEETSFAQIRRARDGVRRFAEKFKPELIKFLSRPAGREIAVHVPALIKTGAVAETVLGQLGETYPILKPALTILTSALSDAAGKDLEKEIDKATSSIATSPESAENVLADMGKKMADSVPITVSPKSRTDVIREVAGLESEASRTDGLRAALNERANAIDTARIDQLFTNLQSRNPNTREAASEALSGMGKSLDREHANRLMKMVRSKGDYVQTRSWRGEHCTHYEKKALKYYAGRAVEKMDSPHVTDAMRREAELAQTEQGGGIEYVRDDDYGWI
ncbi:membrane hypothetical protein [Acidobacteriia bacterium SbA2]|nr:membrane hypothetical protein [Acidobacteriia bacterium SbA2]